MVMVPLALIVLLSFVSCVLSVPTNVTIDDADVEPVPFGSQARLYTINFFPQTNGMWSTQVGGTTFFSLRPTQNELRNIRGGTYTATTEHSGGTQRSIMIDFYGTAITAFFTLGNNNFTACNLILDNVVFQEIRHSPGSRSEDYSYQVPFVTFADLPQTWHQLEIKVDLFSPERLNYVNFDFAEFTYDPERGLPSTPSKFDGSSAPPPAASVSGRGEKTKIAGIVSGVFGGCLVIAAAILVWHLRTRNKLAPSAVHSKVEMSSANATQGSKGFSFRNTFGAFMTKRNSNHPSALPVSIPQYHSSKRYSASSSTASSPKQPMYEGYGNAGKWEDLTSIASSPELRSMAANKHASTNDGRSIFTDRGRPDSLGLHLTNIPYEPAKSYQARSATMSSQLIRSPPSAVSPSRDLTGSYQYSIRQELSSPPVRPLHAM